MLKLRRHIAELLRRKRGVVVADKEVRFCPIGLDLAFGVDHLAAKGSIWLERYCAAVWPDPV